MENKKIFGLQRNVFFTGLTSFFTDTSTKMIYSVMPLFLLSLGATKTSISLIEGIAEYSSNTALGKTWSEYRAYEDIQQGIPQLTINQYGEVINPTAVEHAYIYSSTIIYNIENKYGQGTIAKLLKLKQENLDMPLINAFRVVTKNPKLELNEILFYKK